MKHMSVYLSFSDDSDDIQNPYLPGFLLIYLTITYWTSTECQR